MSTLHRVQLSRRRGWRKPENTVSVARPSRYGNPYRVVQTSCVLGGLCWKVRYTDSLGVDRTYADHFDTKRKAVEAAVEAFRRECSTSPVWMAFVQGDLQGKNLACWSSLDQPCHADVLLEITNGAAS